MKLDSGVVSVACAGSLLLGLGCVPKSAPPSQGKVATAPCGPHAKICDGEDDDNQVIIQEGRGGYWYTFVDDVGSTIEPIAGAHGGTFEMSKGGAHGSAHAARFRGTVAASGTVYCGMGVNFVDPKGGYDASRYGGLSFFAKKGPGTGKVRLKVPDRNTDPDGGVCTECYNDFGDDLELTEDWRQHVIAFHQMRQLSGWGKPQLSHITVSELYAVQFQVNQPG